MLAGAGASVYLRQTTKPSFARMNNRGPAAHCARDARVPGDASHGDTMATIRPGTAALAVTTDSKNRSETVATPVHDLRLLERAGWTNAEVIWEQIQVSAAESERAGDYAEASELWLGGLELAREHFRPGDPRTAASVANVGVAKRRTGDSVAAEHMLDEALVRWDAGEQWIESLKPAAMARSSTFHLRLQSKHPGGYDRFPRERYRTLAMEGRAVLSARRNGLPDESDRLDRWRRERPGGFDDWRKLLGAVLLIASDSRDG